MFAFAAGAAAAGVAFASVEVLWTVLQPLLPFEVLRTQLLMPPRNLPLFLAVAVGTYAAIGALSGAVGALLLRPLIRRMEAIQSFALGAFLLAFGLTSASVVVWLNLLSNRPFFSASSLTLYALCAGIVAVVVGLPCWAIARRGASLAAATVLVALAFPALCFGVALAAHTRIEYPELAERGTPAEKLPNLLFITIDTLRSDYVGSYSGRVKTPVLDQLASEGVRFETALSQVPTTTPSHVSMFTSNYPFAHGAKNGVPLRADLTTLPRELKKLGYHSAAFVSAYTTRSNVTGLGDSFDLYSDSLNPSLSFLSREAVEPLLVYRLLDRMAGNQIDSPVINRRVLSWLDSAPEQPFFAWVHYFDPHKPRDPPESYRALYPPEDESELARDLANYRAAITYTDAQLGRILDEFRSAGLLDDAIIVVTSDHGEAFWEPHPHVDKGHGRHLYDSVLKVPLIFWGPGRIPAGRVVREQVQSVDLAPTLLDLVGAARPDTFVGRSLVPMLSGESERSPAFSQTSNVIRPRWFGIRKEEWKLLVDPDSGEEELFNLRVDAGETENLLSTEPEVASQLRSELSATMRLDEEGVQIDELDDETIRRLRALGYLPDED